MKNVAYIIIATLLLFIRCIFDIQPENSDIIKNGNIEEGEQTPAYWAFAVVGQNKYVSDWSMERYRNFNHSLKIAIQSIDDGGAFAYWWQLIESDIPHNKCLILKAHIKTENISPPGINIAVRTDGPNRVLGFADLKSTVKGSEDWTSYSVCLPPVDFKTEKIYIFLIIYPKTTGVVYFDDISLTSYDL